MKTREDVHQTRVPWPPPKLTRLGAVQSVPRQTPAVLRKERTTRQFKASSRPDAKCVGPEWTSESGAVEVQKSVRVKRSEMKGRTRPHTGRVKGSESSRRHEHAMLGGVATQRREICAEAAGVCVSVSAHGHWWFVEKQSMKPSTERARREWAQRGQQKVLL